MDDDLPTDNYDIIILGTGLSESIVAAAASRIGKTVLHLDNNDYYGGDWASFNLDTLQKHLKIVQHSPNIPLKPEINDKNIDSIKLVPENDFSNIYNVEQNWYIGNKIENNWNKDKIINAYRKFNIDLAPKLLFFKGDLVQLLISSNIARYAEFRSATRVLTAFPKAITDPSDFSGTLSCILSPVPCSRSDVFATRNVNVVEKRMLMKLLNNCMGYKPEEENAEFKGFENKTFMAYLKHKKLTPNIIHYVLYAISMGNDRTNCIDGILKTQRFLNSLGYYGNTPFLYPLYGNGEMSQYFCRLSAVFGGLYCLNRPVTEIVLDKKSDVEKRVQNPTLNEKEKVEKVENISENNNLKFSEIKCGKQNIKAKNFVMNLNFAPREIFQLDYNKEYKKLLNDCQIKETDILNSKSGLSRGIFITNRSILEDNKREHLTLLKMPPLGHGAGAVVLELGRSTFVCPDNLYIVHMTTKQVINAKTDLQPFVEQILNIGPVVEESDTETKSVDAEVLVLGKDTEDKLIDNSDPTGTDKEDIDKNGEENFDPTVDITGDEEKETVEDSQSEDKNLIEEDVRPKVLWSLFFNMHDFNNADLENITKPDNVYLCSGPDLDLDYDTAVQQAKKIFLSMYPDCEFLPRAPDPEEIVFDDPAEAANADGTVILDEKAVQDKESNMTDAHSSSDEEIPNITEVIPEKPKNVEKTKKDTRTLNERIGDVML